MPGLVLSLRSDPRERLDFSPLTPAMLATGDPLELARVVVGTTRSALCLGDVFRIDQRPAGRTIAVECGTARIDGLGTGLGPDGYLIVVGDAGDRAGQGLRGGTLEIRGSAGAHLGAGMARGLIHASGHAGDGIGGLLAGARFGMTGGTIVVGGDAGARTGEKMRRGTIVVRGASGPLTGARMLGGVIAVEGRLGTEAGRLMRRGTVLAPGGTATSALPATFADCGVHDLVILRLMIRDWQRTLGVLAPKLATSRVHRFAGDLATIGKGEVLVPVG
jgi:formylmethanofuran dehydrogenase subunit C